MKKDFLFSLILFILFSATFAQTFQAGCYTIKNQNSNLAIQDNDIVRQQSVGSGNNQKWNFEATSGGGISKSPPKVAPKKSKIIVYFGDSK